MHIAVCDDNIAERKQTERLLSRESDRRKAVTGVFYVHSYGHEQALLAAPMQYNLFLIDMANSETDGLKLALILCQSGITAPIFLCVSQIDYRKAYTQLDKPPGNIHFIDKPLKVAELAKVIDQALVMRANTLPTIELRTESETLYLKESEIVSAKASSSCQSDVCLADARMVRINSSLFNLYSQICHYPAFYLISNKAFVNLSHIDKCSFSKLVLTNSQTFHLLPFKGLILKRYLASASGAE